MYVPIRPIVEALNGNVSWDGKNRVINISFKTDFERRVYELMVWNTITHILLRKVRS